MSALCSQWLRTFDMCLIFRTLSNVYWTHFSSSSVVVRRRRRCHRSNEVSIDTCAFRFISLGENRSFAIRFAVSFASLSFDCWWFDNCCRQWYVIYIPTFHIDVLKSDRNWKQSCVMSYLFFYCWFCRNVYCAQCARHRLNVCACASDRWINYSPFGATKSLSSRISNRKHATITYQFQTSDSASNYYYLLVLCTELIRARLHVS